MREILVGGMRERFLGERRGGERMKKKRKVRERGKERDGGEDEDIEEGA